MQRNAQQARVTDQLNGDDRDRLEDRLTRLLGAIIGGRDLQRSLGFSTPTSFRRAYERGNVGVHTFQIRGRRGRFALARDVANWLVDQATSKASLLHEEKEDASSPA